MAIRNVVFDMGGVLVRNVQIGGEIAWKYHLDEQALLEDYLAYDRPIMDGMLEPRTWWEHACVRFGLPRKDGESPLEDLFHPVPNPSVLQIVRELKERGVPVAVGSNTCSWHWQVIDRLVGVSGMMDRLYLSFAMHVSKPSQEFFHAVVRGEGVDPSEILFIDDTKENVEAAQRAGLQAFWFQDTYLWPADRKLRRLLGLDEGA